MNRFRSGTLMPLLYRLFPICRSLTGNGVRETLQILKERLQALTIHEVPSGTQAFDWEVPNEWEITDAFIADMNGHKIVDFKENNLHVMGYSIPIDEIMDFETLRKHIHSLPQQPEAIPYVTSYYKDAWGFCLSENQLRSMHDRHYHVCIKSRLFKGHMTYADLLIPGTSAQEILFSTYICHPSMANNELSGPVVTSALAEWVLSKKARHYSYRFVFVPETIGSIYYLSQNLGNLQKNVVAGFVVTCVGDNRAYSFLPSRLGNTLADRVAECILDFHAPEHIKYSFLTRGSDERQYCAPGVDLPVVSVMRSKYGTYPEYHTSLDNLSLVSEEGLSGSVDILKKCIDLIENNHFYRINTLCEPQLGKRGLYPTTSTKDSGKSVRNMMNFITYCDGKHDLISISKRIGVAPENLYPIIKQLEEVKLLTK